MDVIPFTRSDVLLNGWLVTRGPSRIPFRSWRPYWCVMAGDQIYYFRLAGSIPLKGCKLLSRTSHDPEEPLGFVLELNPVKPRGSGTRSDEEGNRHGRPYNLCSPKQAELDLWEREIRKVRGGIFGQSLEDTITEESESTTRTIPTIVELCVEYLRCHGFREEGLFRLSGRNGTVQGLQDEFDKGDLPNFEERNTSVHTVASLLKRYLTLLPEPIIPWRHSRYFIPAMQRLHENEADGQKQLMMQLALLPRVNYNLLKYLCEFLHEVHLHQIYNKMSLGNLANIFAPHILRPQHAEGQFLLGSTALSLQLVYYLVRHQDIIFPPFSALLAEASFRPQELINLDKLAKEATLRPEAVDLPLPKEAEIQVRDRVMNIHLPRENNYTNNDIIERNSCSSEGRASDGFRAFPRGPIYENIERSLPHSSPSAGSVIEAFRSRIPPKPKPRTDQRAKRYGISPSIISNLDINHRSFSNASTTLKSSNLSDDSKELGILFQKPKWQKAESMHSDIISTYQNLEFGSQPLACIKDPKVSFMNFKNAKSSPKVRDGKSVAAKRAIFAASHENLKKTITAPIPVPRSFPERSIPDENCNDRYEVSLPMDINVNGEAVLGTVKGLKSELQERDKELTRQQKMIEKLRRELEVIKSRLSLEAIAREQAESENKLLQEQLERLRHRMSSL